MQIRKRTYLAAFVALLGCGAATFAFAFPRAATCSAVRLSGFDTLPDGTLIPPGASPELRRLAVDLRTRAEDRITTIFGAPHARPLVVFMDKMNGWWALDRNATAGTDFVPTHVCVVIGPDGRNVDVVAHELMHAEVFGRLGYARRLTQIPIWFDEGVAMQVDHRVQFDRPVGMGDTAFVRALDTGPEFFLFEDGKHVRNYAAAKHEVRRWLGDDGHHALYPRLERIRAGEEFADVGTRRERGRD